jgi:hypothetical protein
MTTVGALTYISEKIPMFSNVFEMAITIPIAVIALALHPYICFAAVAISAVSVCVIYIYISFLIFFSKDCYCFTRLFAYMFRDGVIC